MPLSQIESFRARQPHEVTALLEALYDVQQDTLKLPAHDRQIRYIEHSTGWALIPPNRTNNYLIVQISLFAGRSLETKRRLYQGIVERFERCGIDANDVFILLNEQPLENWGIRGGIPACDVDLGFQVNL